MPKLYIAGDKGAELRDVVTSASSTGKDIELVINVSPTNVPVGDKQSVVTALENIIAILVQNPLP